MALKTLARKRQEERLVVFGCAHALGSAHCCCCASDVHSEHFDVIIACARSLLLIGFFGYLTNRLSGLFSLKMAARQQLKAKFMCLKSKILLITSF
jgi:hypothetical protein